MKLWKSVKIALGILLIAPIALAANIALRTGPVDPSSLRGELNQLVQDVNSGVAGLLYANGTLTTNSGTAEATLFSYTVPANYLAVNGQSITAKCYVGTAATADNKTLLLYFGASSITTAAAANNAGGGWLEFTVVRTGAATQTISGSGQWGAAGVTPIITQHVAGANDLTTALDIRCRALDAVSGGTIGRQLVVETIR